MDTTDPHVAQQIVGAYAALLKQHAHQNVYPASLAVLPYPKEVIKASVRTSVAGLASTGALTNELRDFLEVAYISLADYIEDDLVRLIHEHQQASAALAAAGRSAASFSSRGRLGRRPHEGCAARPSCGRTPANAPAGMTGSSRRGRGASCGRAARAAASSFNSDSRNRRS